ncbi:RES family NAD+ phosphorylase [Rheinheimera sp.]|uniref:RES family NAD+ phosphorylase n=1 Tax=Rheinheimera sp. TaxID=1869214 RepID=UPI0027333E95|nr:RES family NAD+ phosphorylase [Rheinheimera sp.]MDP2715923.1 RES family NAD+ phosphorylase [Rheinheimera sp.]
MNDLQHPDVLKRIVEELKQASAGGLSRNDVGAMFKQLIRSYYLFGITRSHHQVWYRARVCENGEIFHNVDQMIYPKNGSPSFNRASFPNTKVLYAGWNSRLALEEIGAKAGDLVQLIRLRVKSPVEFPCAIIGEYQAIFNSGRSIINSEKSELAVEESLKMHPAYVLAQAFVDSAIAEIFRSDPIAKDYFVSATIAEDFILDKAQGLMYPSVRTAHCVNLAVRAEDFDKNFEVLDTMVSKVAGYHGYGLYALEPLAQTCEISADGSFIWDSKREITSTLGRRRDEQISADFVGWRAQ